MICVRCQGSQVNKRFAADGMVISDKSSLRSYGCFEILPLGMCSVRWKFFELESSPGNCDV
jgi:hypothetical protein